MKDFYYLACLILCCSGYFFLSVANANYLINDLEPEELIQNYPGAVSIKIITDTPFVQVFDKNNKLLGHLVLSEDITSLKGYSGAPLNTLIGINQRGYYQSIKIIEHSEPIVLIGLPESTLTDFVKPYQHHHINEDVIFDSYDDQKQATNKQQITVDAISGATVTALVLNETIRTSVGALGKHFGLLNEQQEYKGDFVNNSKPWSWEKMSRENIFGQLNIKTTDFDPAAEERTLSRIWYTLADAPQIGRPLLGKRRYEHYMQTKATNAHILVVFSQGNLSFKGSGFARGGIFDRFRLEQGHGGSTSATIFRDSDYKNMPQPALKIAPRFTEGGIFIIPENKINPAIDFEFVFLASQHEVGGAYKRQFKSFKSTFRLPESVYQRQKILSKSNEPYWKQAWSNKQVEIIVTIFLLFIFVVFFTLARTGRVGSIEKIKKFQVLYFILVLSIFGFYLNGQLSIVNVLTVAQFFKGDIEFTLFLTEPIIFILWFSVVILVLIYGRGIYCGWLCPFGALTELIYRAGQALGVKTINIPEAIDNKLIYVKHLVFLAIVFSSIFISNQWGLQISEIEPFKYTFAIAPWSQSLINFFWWAVIILMSLFLLKPFCRYFCPLGVFFILSGYFSCFHLPRVHMCQRCSICYKDCDYNAIKKNGTIANEECTLCLTCLNHIKGFKTCPDYKLRKNINYTVNFKPKIHSIKTER
jgi:NosR/NirI family nitrous oxide reductase transcriptional regulator